MQGMKGFEKRMELTYSERIKNIDPRPLKDMFAYGVDPEIISFACGNPDSSMFPHHELASIAADVLDKKPVQSLQYGKTNGYGPFIETLRARLRDVQKITCAADELLVTTGAQQAMEMISKILVNDGDVVLVEEPSFIGSLNAFRSYGAKLVGIPLEDDGMNVDYLENYLKHNREKISFIYTIPTSSNPMGTTMSEEKRRAFYDVIKRYRVPVLEDDAYGELCFDGVHPTTLKSMDTEHLVIYIGTFSKILAPALRIGYVCADADFIDTLSMAKQTADLQTALLPQLLCDGYLKTFDIKAHIKRLQTCYKEKCDMMLDCIDRYFPKDIYYTRPKGGLFVWCDLKRDIDTNEMIKDCLKEKVAFVPGYAFMTDLSVPRSTMRLNFTAVSKELMPVGMERLGKVIEAWSK